MEDNKNRVKDKISIGILVIVVVLIAFFMIVGIVSTIRDKEKISSNETSNESQIADSDTGENNTSTENGTTDDETVTTEVTTEPIIFKELVCVEAGTTEIDIKELFLEYKDQVCSIETQLTQEELRIVGAVYELEVVFEGGKYSVKAEVKDTTPPTIEGVKDIYVCLGDTISYRKNLVLSDNGNGEVTIIIDNKAVDVSKIGEYPVEYKAVDMAGNSATANITVFVTEKPVINEDYMAPYIQSVVDSVVKEDMTDMDKAYALYRWCKKNINYLYGSTDRSSVWQGAYDGIIGRLGDCYVYCCTYQVLLTYAGIENMVVTRTHETSNHWWNLVKIDEGWYHCDASPRTRGDNYKCFMQTDEQIAAYAANNTRPYYYDFDKTLYPERGTVVVYNK